MHVLLIAQASAVSAILGGIRDGVCPNALPIELRSTHNTVGTQMLNEASLATT